jgi:hypothetical protein
MEYDFLHFSLCKHTPLLEKTRFDMCENREAQISVELIRNELFRLNACMNIYFLKFNCIKCWQLCLPLGESGL